MTSYKYIAVAAGLYGGLFANAAPANLDFRSSVQEIPTPTVPSIHERQAASVIGTHYIPAITSLPACAQALQERQDVAVIGTSYIPAITSTPVCAPALQERQAVSVIGFSSVPVVTDVCSLSSTDAPTFENSGAVQFMDNFIKTNGEQDWLFNMDQQTTGDGTQPSSLNCKPLGGQTCSAPTVQCQFFTPQELFFIRVAATNAHDFFTAAHETLQNIVITESLKIDQVLADFAPSNPEPAGNFISDLLKTIAPGFSMADKVSKQPEINPLESRGRQSDFFGFVGGVLGLAAGSLILSGRNQGDQVNLADLKVEMENQLASIFTTSNDNISKLNSKLFGGGDDIDLGQIISLVSTVQGGSSPDPNLHPITQIFSSGAFLDPVDQSQISAGISSGFQLIKQQLVGHVLAAQNYFVFVDTTRTLDQCNQIVGSRFINNQCFTIEQRTVNGIQCQADSQAIDSSIALKLDDQSAGYNFDLPAFYQNVQACQNGQLASSVELSGTFPACAFGIPYVEAAGSVCGATNSGIPDNLQINSAGCDKVICARPKLGGGCQC